MEAVIIIVWVVGFIFLIAYFGNKSTNPPGKIKDPNEYLKTESSTGWFLGENVCWHCETLRSWDEGNSQHCNNCGGSLSTLHQVSQRTIWNGTQWIKQWRGAGVRGEYMLYEPCESGYEWVRYYKEGCDALRGFGSPLKKPYKVIGTDEVVR